MRLGSWLAWSLGSTDDTYARPVAAVMQYLIGMAESTRAKRVRITVDLDRGQHRQLKVWILNAAAGLGVNVTQADVVRAMITLLVERPDLAGVVTHLLSQQRAAG